MRGDYVCPSCGHKGNRIWEQVAELLPRIPPGGALQDAIRYACWLCGGDVRPKGT